MEKAPAHGPLFITGFPRSGTTLMRALLGAHSAIALQNEPEIIRAIHESGYTLAAHLGPNDVGAVLERLQAHPSGRDLTETKPARLSELRALAASGESVEAVTLYEKLLPVDEGSVIWGEKSLGNLFYLDDLLTQYPSSVVVHMVRDPRATLLSYYRKRFHHAVAVAPVLDRDTAIFFLQQAVRWARWQRVLESDRARTALTEGRLQVVRFEDLVSDPASALAAVCRALAVPFEPQMLDAEKRGADVVIRDPSTRYAHRELVEPVNPERASAADELPEWASYIVQRVARRAMQAHGYGPAPRRPGAIERLRLNWFITRHRWTAQRAVAREVERRGGGRAA